MREPYPNELMHYGVLGMKWGIRRYQPYSEKPRGSGKGGKEVGEARKSARKERVQRAFEPTVKVKDGPNISIAEKVAKNTKSGVENAADIARTVSRMRSRGQTSKASGMTNEELQTAIRRMELERRYDSLTMGDDSVSRGFDYATDILSIVGGVVGIAGGAISSYVLLKTLGAK